ncbi:hypothetical protein TNIN_220861 [Trichonephila inaurata madagascariensis]|uniref:Uncharacterized protein n=1 Tax=Trichonephila inaurata madagascariensis TaxID=2747483 RepID=A0A8X6KHY7_9ARAC|nr:hypothetical protein TNIN_220861 [Trichonephila inaurata madagascariensis]
MSSLHIPMLHTSQIRLITPNRQRDSLYTVSNKPNLSKLSYKSMIEIHLRKEDSMAPVKAIQRTRKPSITAARTSTNSTRAFNFWI